MNGSTDQPAHRSPSPPLFRLALAGVVALHLAVRIPLLSAPWWVDEGIGVVCASQPLREIPRLARADFAPPLHGLLMSAWGEAMGLLGLRPDLPRAGIGWRTGGLGTYNVATIPLPEGGAWEGAFGPEAMAQWDFPPLWIYRLPTLLFSLGLLLGAVLFAQRATGSGGVALGVGALLAIAPHAARWDTVVRYMTPLSLAVLGMAAALWGIAGAERLRARPWLLPALALATLAALLIHYMGALFAAALGLWLPLVDGPRRWRRTAAAGAAMASALAVFLLLWAPSLRTQWAMTGPVAEQALGQRRDWLNHFPLQPALPQRLLVGLEGQSGVEALFPPWWPWGLTGLLLIAAAGYLVRLARGGGTRLDTLILLWLFGPALLAVAIEALRPQTVGLAWRHFMPAAPAAALLFVLGAKRLMPSIPHPLPPRAGKGA